MDYQLSRRLSRREFVGIMAACGVGLAGGAQAADKKPGALTLGFGLYGAKGVKLEEFLPKLAGLGFESVELCLLPGWGCEPAQFTPLRRRDLARLLDGAGLKLTCLMEQVDLAGDGAAQRSVRERLARAAELGRALAPQSPPVLETTMGNGNWEQLRTQFRDNLGGWAETAKSTQTVIAIKPHRLQAVNLPEQALWLLEQVPSPWIRLAYDFSHYVHRDLTLAGTLDKLLPHTAFIHVKDTVIENGKARFLLPGESGQIDYAELFRKLKAASYRGDVCCEVSGMVSNKPGYDPLEAARISYKHMALAMQQAGITRSSAGSGGA